MAARDGNDNTDRHPEPARPARSRYRLGSVRVRLTMAAVMVVGVALVVGAVAVLLVLRATLTGDVRSAASLQATRFAAAISDANGIVPAITYQDGELLQVLDGSGRVVAASPELVGAGPIPGPRGAESVQVDGLVDDGRYLVVQASADRADLRGGPFTVLVPPPLDDVTEPVTSVTVALLIVLPTLLLVVGGTTWRVTGRALAPVEAMRQQVDAISASELYRRVPNPPGDDEIARLARTMNRALDRLEQSQTRQRRFVSDASHELRSPVAAIRQYAEVVAAHPDIMSAAQLARTVLAENLRVQRLVDDLLLLAKADEHSLHLRVRAVDVDDLVLAEARHLRHTTTLTVDTSGVSAARVDGDHAALARAVRNLSENAARHAHGQVTFTLTEIGGRVVLGVEDDGPGIPLQDRERIFERFVRLDAARDTDTGGSGLGLAIVAELVHAHGGAVATGEGPLGGARIQIDLPATS